MECPPDESLRIGDWRVDPALNEISRDGRTIRLEARAMGLLLRLAKRPGQVVSVDELLTDVWSDVVVTADSVYQAIASLRRELGDDAKQPAYIATIPRLGYRMIAPVCPWTEEESLPPVSSVRTDAQPDEAATSSSSRRALVYGVIAALVVGCLALLSNLRASRTQPVTAVAVLPFLDLTTQAMDEEYFADGLTEEVITRLSKVPSLRVAAPASSFALQGKQLKASEIGDSLGVAYVIDGSIRRSDTQWRVAVRLTRTDDGYVVWSDTYENTLAEKLATQDAVAERTAQAMQRLLERN